MNGISQTRRIVSHDNTDIFQASAVLADLTVTLAMPYLRVRRALIRTAGRHRPTAALAGLPSAAGPLVYIGAGAEGAPAAKDATSVPRAQCRWATGNLEGCLRHSSTGENCSSTSAAAIGDSS